MSYLFFDSLRYLSTKTISILVFLDPAVAILLDTVLTGFRPTLMQITGILFIFIGMTLTLKKSKDKKLSQKEKRIESDASISQQ